MNGFEYRAYSKYYLDKLRKQDLRLYDFVLTEKIRIQTSS